MLKPPKIWLMSLLQTVENDYLNSSLWEVEPFLYNWGKFSDSPAFFTKDILCSGGQDNDFSTCWCDTDFYTTVAIFCQLSRQKIVQLSLEHSICNELQKTICFSYRVLYATHRKVYPFIKQVKSLAIACYKIPI